MPEHLRAFLYILALTLPVFWLGRKVACGLAIEEADFKRRRNLWLALTALAFVSQNFWIYAAGAFVLMTIAGMKEPNRLGMYLFVLFAVPPFSATVAGFGGINYFVDVDHLRLLSLTILLPAYFSLRRDKETVSFGRNLADVSLLSYVLLQLLLQSTVDTVTNTLRSGVYAFIDVFLPYYVASRSMRDLKTCRDALMSFVFAAMLMAPIAAFEYLKHWLLYQNLPAAMGLHVAFGGYMDRGDNLRAVASTGHAIVLGYVMVTALGLYAFVGQSVANKKMRWLGLGMLVLTLLVAISRGPWVGGAAVLGIILLSARNRFALTGRFLAIAVPVAAVLLVSPFGDKIIDLLPFVGTVDEFNVTYRQRLVTVSMDVVMMHPLLGSFDYLSVPIMQDLVQGEGIIDMVNSYLGIALAYGFVGLTLFSGVFLSAAWDVLRGMRASSNDELYVLGRALLAALAGVMVTIATVSGVLSVPTVYWVLAGLCVGYTNLSIRREAGHLPEVATANWAGSHRQHR